jgi:hypothetical protein
MPSQQQIKFHGAMMGQLRNCMKRGYIDDSPDTKKALKYARRLLLDPQLQKNIAAGLSEDFSMKTDLKNILLAIALAEKPAICGTTPKDTSLTHEEEMIGPEDVFDLDEFQARCSPEEWEEMNRVGQGKEREEEIPGHDIPF